MASRKHFCVKLTCTDPRTGEVTMPPGWWSTIDEHHRERTYQFTAPTACRAQVRVFGLPDLWALDVTKLTAGLRAVRVVSDPVPASELDETFALEPGATLRVRLGLLPAGVDANA